MMTDPLVTLAAVVTVLSGALAYIIRQRRNGRWDGVDRRDTRLYSDLRSDIADLRSEWRAVRQEVHNLRDELLTPLLVTVEGIRKDVEHLIRGPK